MDQFTRSDLKQLIDTTQEPLVSIYMPTYRSGREVQQNSTRFKNLLKGAREKLADYGLDEVQITELLSEASTLESNDDWWEHQSDGLAIFFASDRFVCYRVPFKFEELVFVGSHYYIRPVIQLLQGDGRFYVLAVSQNRVRLLAGSHYSIEELEPDQLPSDLQSALNIDEYTSTLQQHSTGGPNTAKNIVFHGHGAADMDQQKKDEILQYFHHIDTAIQKYFGNEKSPMVFAGVDYLFPLFKSTCHYKYLLEEPVTGNPDELTAEQLHSQAWPVVESFFTRDCQTALEYYNESAASDTSTCDLGKTIRAAKQGAVNTLLLAEDKQHWGEYKEQDGSITTCDERMVSDELLNYAAVQTLITGGTVFSLPGHSIPSGESAAVLRFPVS
ncbi:hypothetical protein [Gimesia maris]|uniref:baeRF7 domain-containing protein n=1 Tax=Gimesia maris TaxID=122 RepID=UPI00241EA25A|nr:hypothetical protein [Gimesia maris]|tara:strand:- start:36669 stop:37826 length:1158 start_codon:yes stop_codon:yes gene_type:complete